MAKINNQAILQKVIDELGLYPGLEAVPTELADKILPVFQVNTQEIIVTPEPANVVRTGAQTTQGSSTLYTTPSNQFFYLTNVTCECHAQAPGLALAANAYVTITIDGADQVVAFAEIDCEATAGWLDRVTFNFQNPIKIDKSTNITLTDSGNSLIGNATIVGYTTD